MIQEASELSPSVVAGGMWIGIGIAIAIVIVAAIFQVRSLNKDRRADGTTIRPPGGGSRGSRPREGTERPR